MNDSGEESVLDAVRWPTQPSCGDEDRGKISDGYHTFDELYAHRAELFLALCRMICALREKHRVWRSKLHDDGSMFVGWFIMGIDMAPGDQITYHLPLRHWNHSGFALTLEKAPPFDGHTPSDVLKRLADL
jgi:hypothetical protein